VSVITIKANTIIIFFALCGQLQRDELSKENGKIIRLWNNQKDGINFTEQTR